MMSSLSLILVMSEYLITCNSIYSELEDFIDSFEQEAEVLNAAKCILLNNGKISDMQLSQGTAYVEDLGGTCRIRYNSLEMIVEISDRMISDYQLL